MNRNDAMSELMRPHPVCLCNNVSEKRILEEIEKGARSFEELQGRTGCSTKCGNCAPRVHEILKKHSD